MIWLILFFFVWVSMIPSFLEKDIPKVCIYLWPILLPIGFLLWVILSTGLQWVEWMKDLITEFKDAYKNA